jgi:hypothetical protein
MYTYKKQKYILQINYLYTYKKQKYILQINYLYTYKKQKYNQLFIYVYLQKNKNTYFKFPQKKLAHKKIRQSNVKFVPQQKQILTSTSSHNKKFVS